MIDFTKSMTLELICVVRRNSVRTLFSIEAFDTHLLCYFSYSRLIIMVSFNTQMFE